MDQKGKEKITVYYDGACPSCIRDRENYEKMVVNAGESVDWFDITGKDEQLREIGIDPCKAMTELHVRNERQEILSELDAYILLMQRVPRLKLLAWLIGLPIIRPALSALYRLTVRRRLKASGRL